MMSPQPAKRNAVLYVDDVTKLEFRRLFRHQRIVNKTRIYSLINQIQMNACVRLRTFKYIHGSTPSNKGREYIDVTPFTTI